MKSLRVIISGGGTAGHIFPALTLGQKLIEKDPSIQITYVGGARELEKKIMAHHQVDFISLRIEGIRGRGSKIIKSLLLLPYSFIKSLWILVHIRPRLVVGVGGYSSGPVVLLASWMRIPTLIMEQNRLPGFTNRVLLPWVEKAVAAFESSLSEFKGKGVFIGNPVREKFYLLPPKNRNKKLSLLIFGGSQGSHFLNQKISESLPLLKEEKDHLTIYHQTGEKDREWIKNEYSQHKFEDVTVASFFYDMAEYFQKSDLIISRAGASTIAELIAAQKASLLIPFSKATDNHQLLNAKELKTIGGADIILEEKFTSQTFAQKILDFIQDKEKITRMERNLKQIRTDNVAEKISDLCMEMMGRKLQEDANW